jgi:hypothetical protein
VLQGRGRLPHRPGVEIVGYFTQQTLERGICVGERVPPQRRQRQQPHAAIGAAGLYAQPARFFEPANEAVRHRARQPELARKIRLRKRVAGSHETGEGAPGGDREAEPGTQRLTASRQALGGTLEVAHKLECFVPPRREQLVLRRGGHGRGQGSPRKLVTQGNNLADSLPLVTSSWLAVPPGRAQTLKL